MMDDPQVFFGLDFEGAEISRFDLDGKIRLHHRQFPRRRGQDRPTGRNHDFRGFPRQRKVLNLDKRDRTENKQTRDQEQPFFAHEELLLFDQPIQYLPSVPSLVNALAARIGGSITN